MSEKKENIKDIINEHVKFRMGNNYDKKIFIEDINVSNIITENNEIWKKVRLIDNKFDYQNIENLVEKQRISDLEKYFSKFNNTPFLISVQDEIFSCQKTIIKNNKNVPIFGFNRHHTLKDDVILLPLISTATYGLWTFPNLEDYDIKWNEKQEKLIWRGTITGVIYNTYNPDSENIRWELATLINYYNLIINKKLPDEFSGLWNPKTLIKTLFLNFPRFKLCEQYLNNDLIDCGFVNKDYNKDLIIDDFKDLWKSKKNFKELLEYKYLLIVEGNDWASNFAWVFDSNSCPIMCQPKFDSIFTKSLIPWKHYVPVFDDYSNLEEILLYLKENDKLAYDISQESKKYIQIYKDNELMDAIVDETLKKYSSNLISKKD